MNEVEILTRSDATLSDVNAKKRIIEVIAVPWEQEAQVLWRGEMWTEVFDRSAFRGIESRAGQVRVNREHRKGETVGKVIEFDSAHPKGLFTRLKVVSGPKGDELLALAEEDMVSASIGYRANKASDVELNRTERTRRVRNAFLDHLSMVEDPAYRGAEVLAVRERPSGIAVVDGPLPETPGIEELLNDPVLRWARERCSA